MKTAYIDTETVGLYGPMAILQYAFDEDNPKLYNPWLEPVGVTLSLIERIYECRVVAHNLTFDHQKLQSFYNAAYKLCREQGADAIPLHWLDEMVEYFYTERSEFCLKPPAAICTLLLCQKHLGGTSLAAKEVRVRQVPRIVAEALTELLNTYTDLPPIVFAKRRDGGGWHVGESDKGDQWADVVMKFDPSNGLKEVSKLVLGVQDTQKIGTEVLPPVMPFELGYCPFAYVLKRSGIELEGPLWPELLKSHIDFWNTNPNAVKYALSDIVLLRQLDDYFNRPEQDFDGDLAVQVASCRQAGFEIDMEQLAESARESLQVVDTAMINTDAHAKVKAWLSEVLDPMERHVVSEGCNKATLKKLVKNFVATEREECDCGTGCVICRGKGYLEPGPLVVAERAAHVLEVRKHKKRLQLYNKLSVAKGAFPSFRVIGAKSGRMSGADSLNYHGIDGSREIRSIFTLAKDGWVVSGGDMNSQELAIAAAVMNDESLAVDIETGRSLHGEFAATILECSYDQIMAKKEDKGTPEGVAYAKAKVCVYAMLYGAAAFNISLTLGCSEAEANRKIEAFFERYPHMKSTRETVKASLQCLRSTETGRIEIKNPDKDYIDSCFGFRRSFEIEMSIIRTLVSAMDNTSAMFESGGPLATWSNTQVIRRENKGSQTIKGAIQSALFGACFSLQGKVQRAALNHIIQSAGRTCTLRVQKRIWDEVQPVGIRRFRVKLMSVHDEVVTVSHRDDTKRIEQAVFAEMRELTRTIPLLSLDWSTDVGSWYGVKSATDGLRCGWTEEDEQEFEEMMDAVSPGNQEIMFD